MSSDFHLFSPLHLGIIVGIPVVAGALTYTTRRHSQLALAARITLAAILLTDGLSWHTYRYIVQGVRFPESYRSKCVTRRSG